MNKKVLSAILFSALFAGTGTFTSCIDTDEPASIAELRGAKAALLKAQVLYEEARAEKQKADARKVDAEAAKLNAEADGMKLSNQLLDIQRQLAEAKLSYSKDSLENEKAMLEIELEKAKADLKAQLMKSEQDYAEAERAYELAMKQIQIAQALLSDAEKVKLGDVQVAFNTAYDAHVKALKEVNKLEAALFDTKYSAHDSLYLLEMAQFDVKEEIADSVEAEYAVAKYKNFLEVEGKETADWRAQIEQIQKDVDALDKELAVLKLAKDTIKASEAYTALEKVQKEAADAFKAEVDSMTSTSKDFAFKMAEEMSDTLKLNDSGDLKLQLVEIKKGESKYDVLGRLAGVNYAEYTQEAGKEWTLEIGKAYDKTSLIYTIEKDINSYTKETRTWLDSIANMDATAIKEANDNAEAALKMYTDALKAFNSSTPAEDLAKLKKAAEDAKTKFDTDYSAATDAGKKKTAAEAYRKALAAWYAAAAKNGMTFDKFALPTYDATGTLTGGASKGVNEWLADATQGASYLLMMIEGKDGLFTVVTSDYFITAGTTNKAEGKEVDILESKKLATSTTAAIITAEKNLLEPLKTASELAFGKVENYVNGGYPTTATVADQGYLHSAPDSVDFQYIYKFVGQGGEASGKVVIGDKNVDVKYYTNLGVYGFSKVANSVTIKELANNYKSYIEANKALLAKYEALVAEIVEEMENKFEERNNAFTAKDAADNALTAYEKEQTKDIEAQEDILKARKEDKNTIITALTTAVNAYLSKENKPTEGYTNAKAFDTWLETQLATAEKNLITAKEDLRKDREILAAIENGSFTHQEAVVTKAAELEDAKAKLAIAEADLAEAEANLEAALEIMQAEAE